MTNDLNGQMTWIIWDPRILGTLHMAVFTAFTRFVFGMIRDISLKNMKQTYLFIL